MLTLLIVVGSAVALAVGLALFSVSVTYAATLSTIETLPGNQVGAPDATRKVTHTSLNESGTYDAGTTPPATLIADFTATLSGGALTIDLRNLQGTNAAVVDGNGLKVQFVRVKNNGANPLTIKSGASNGHTGFFTATTGTIVPVGGTLMIRTNDNGDDIDATHKTWDLSGTAAQTSTWTIIMG